MKECSDALKRQGARPATEDEIAEFYQLYPLAEVIPVKVVDRWCPSCQAKHSEEEWQEIMGQEQGEWELVFSDEDAR